MSLTSFVAMPEVKAQFKATFHLRGSHFALEPHPMIAPPQTTNYALVGTAFDYLMRFAIERHNTQVQTNKWIAEAVVDLPFFDAFDDEQAFLARGFVEQARIHQGNYLADGVLTDELLRSCLLLAQVDPFIRSGSLYEPFGVINLGDVVDLKNVYAALPLEQIRTTAVCLLNPMFDHSRLVHGADCDLLLDGKLIDIKTTKYLQVKAEYVIQLLGYYSLHRLGGISHAPSGHPIDCLGIYFSRHGYLATFPVVDIVDEEKMPAFLAWFKSKACEVFPLRTPAARFVKGGERAKDGDK